MIEYAEKHTNRHAAKHFNINESSVRCFRKQKEQLVQMKPTKMTNRHGNPHWPELEVKLKGWVDRQPKKPKINDIQSEAMKMAKSLKLTNFNGSTSYIFKFMQRHGITASSPRPRKAVKVEKSNDDNDDGDDDDDND
jgi:Tc5 transposase DNA-binding domain